MSNDKFKGGSVIPGLPGGPSLRPPMARPQKPSKRNATRLLHDQSKMRAAIKHAPPEVAHVARVLLANAKLKDGIAEVGTALPIRQKAAAIPDDASADQAGALGIAHRELMIALLTEMIRFMHANPEIPDEYASTLIRLQDGLRRVHGGRSFYIFEPAERKTALPIGDVAAVKRAAISAAVDAYKYAGDSLEAACKRVAKRMEICEATDFAFPAGELITWSQIETVREEVSAGRVKSYKQSIQYLGKKTTPHDVYHDLKATARRCADISVDEAKQYAAELLLAAIERRGTVVISTPSEIP